MSNLDLDQTADLVEQLSPELLFCLANDLSTLFALWGLEPFGQKLVELRAQYPFLERIVNFDTLLDPLHNQELDSFEFNKSPVSQNIQAFSPGLLEVKEQCAKKIESIPSGEDKARWWLQSVAKSAGANAEVEASVYLASRDLLDQVDVQSVEHRWYEAVCSRITELNGIDQHIRQLAETHSLPLSQAANLLSEHDRAIDRFFSCFDVEEEHIDASMFRAVDTLGISGYEKWLTSFALEFSEGSYFGIDSNLRGLASWSLFYWCCSDLALRMSERSNLEAYLLALATVSRPLKPWERYRFNDEKTASRIRSSLTIASTFAFAWSRISPANLDSALLTHAVKLISESQLRNGAWPTYPDQSSPSLVSTCTAIHALAALRPSGWDRLASAGASWLKKQQEPQGYWHVVGGPTVRLTVMVLDSIDLASGSQDVTFKLTGSSDTQKTTINYAILLEDERKELIAILAEYPEFLDATSRSSFVYKAGLGHLRPELDMSGPSGQFVTHLLDKAEATGDMLNSKGLHQLVTLLSAILDLGHAPPHDVTTIRQVKQRLENLS